MTSRVRHMPRPTYQTVHAAVIAEQKKHQIFNISPTQFKFLLIQKAIEFQFELSDVEQLTKELSIPFDISWVPIHYRRWSPNLSNLFGGCVSFTNPNDLSEYVLIVQSKHRSNVSVLRRTINGFSAQDFTHLVPVSLNAPELLQQLSDLKDNMSNNIKERCPQIADLPSNDVDKGSLVRGKFASCVSKPMEEWLQDKKVALDYDIVQFIHAFFDIALPQVENICLKCFKVSMPALGFGIQYKNVIVPGHNYEIRLSSEKMGGQGQQRYIYITNRIQCYGHPVYIKWHQLPSFLPLELKYSLTQNVKDAVTHIPYLSANQQELFNFLKSKSAHDYFKKLAPLMQPSKFIIPICQCR